MDNEPSTPAPPEVRGNSAPVSKEDKRPAHLAAWFDATSDEERKAAVQKHPQLRQIFSEAQNH